MQANSIEEVLELLQMIVDEFERNNNPLGYFTAIYIKTTQKVHEGVKNKIFDNNEKMLEIDVNFANLYFEAITCFNNNTPAKPHWQVCFDACSSKEYGFSQHFLASANAHINYDLALASAQTYPGKTIHNFQNDFNKMNQVLASLYNEVDKELGAFWPLYHSISSHFGNVLFDLNNFTMRTERNKSWDSALKIASGDIRFQENLLAKVAADGFLILHPKDFILKDLFKWESMSEKYRVSERINILTK